MKFILAKKLEMTQVWQKDKAVPVTKLAAGPCPVVQLRTVAKDGYTGVQVGYGERQAKNINRPEKGHNKELGNFRYLKEFRVEATGDLKTGDVIRVGVFAPGDTVKVTGWSKGRGFAGVVKRHGFHGHNTTHGTKDQVRMSGSIGATAPQHVLKGTRMSGRMGGTQVTTTNLEVVSVDDANGFIYIKGSVPGARNGLLLVSGIGDLILTVGVTEAAAPAEPVAETAEEAKTEEAAAPEEPVSAQ